MLRTRSSRRAELIAIALFLAGPSAWAARTATYSGFASPVHGDIRTVGMAGNGLGDTFLSAAENPSGLAMDLGLIDTSIVHDAVHDSNVQTYNPPLEFGAEGIAVAYFPWGFSFGIVPTGIEGQEGAQLIQAKEYRVAVAHLFGPEHRLSIGVSLDIGVANEQDQVLGGPLYNQGTAAFGLTLGGTWKFEDRLLLGAGLTTPMHYSFDGTIGPPGFFQNMETPLRGHLALGWIPNRFLRGDFQLSVFGTTQGAALLANDAALVGQKVTVQPAFGFAYVFADYHILEATAYGGSYYEFSRIQGAPDRLHGTGGFEAKIYLATLGLGVDHANGYNNFLYSIGVDVGLVLEYFRLIPHFRRPDPHGALPDPTRVSDVGLPGPLTEEGEPKKDGQGPDLVKIVKKVPENIKKEVKRIKEGENVISLPKDEAPAVKNNTKGQ